MSDIEDIDSLAFLDSRKTMLHNTTLRFAYMDFFQHYLGYMVFGESVFINRFFRIYGYFGYMVFWEDKTCAPYIRNAVYSQ